MIKAWNEWAEGNVLEPSVKFDYEILESVKQVKREVGFLDHTCDSWCNRKKFKIRTCSLLQPSCSNIEIRRESY